MYAAYVVRYASVYRRKICVAAISELHSERRSSGFDFVLDFKINDTGFTPFLRAAQITRNRVGKERQKKKDLSRQRAATRRRDGAVISDYMYVCPSE